MEETAKEAAEKGIIFDFSMLQDKQVREGGGCKSVFP